MQRTKKGWIGGACGDYMALTHFLEWIENGCKKKFVAIDKEFSGILMSPDGALYFLDHIHKTRLSALHYAIGSGSDIALAAFEMKATAEQAVAVAIKLNTHCGGDIQIIKRKA